MQEVKLILAPIRGITDSIYRNAISKAFGGIDYALAPYITTKSSGEFNKRQFNDLNPSNNHLPIVAQILTKEADQFLELAEKMEKIGVKKIDLNMGCPYPMVTNRGKGSGLLPHPEKVRTLLKEITEKCSCELSIKLRLGMENPDEILSIIPILNDLKIEDITIHPRIAKQLYKGESCLDGFKNCLEKLTTAPTYNGDITTPQDLIQLQQQFPTITKWMIGRGALENPALFSMIKRNNYSIDKYKKRLTHMHQLLCEGYLNQDNGKSTFLQKMKGHWSYLAMAFENEAKVFKKIKKAQSINHYNDAVEWVFEQDLDIMCRSMHSSAD